MPCSAETLEELERQLCWSTRTRPADANAILQRRAIAPGDKLDVLRRMRDLADAMREALAGLGNLDEFARSAPPRLGAEAFAGLWDQFATDRRVV